jgi:orotidine-5'-phosphate decarboxylase
MVNSRIIVALDAADRDFVIKPAKQLDPKLCRVKMGKEAFVAGFPQLIADLKYLGYEIFLDLKFHDIPNTVAAACKAVEKLGVWMMNVHASGGRNMLLAVRDTVQIGATKLIAVMVRASIDDLALHEVGVPRRVEDQVLRLAKLTQECGLDGVVCSVREVPMLRNKIDGPFALVTPGIRLSAAAQDDQIRVVTPQDALRAGADYLVIARQISAAKNPGAALNAIYSTIY